MLCGISDFVDSFKFILICNAGKVTELYGIAFNIKLNMKILGVVEWQNRGDKTLDILKGERGAFNFGLHLVFRLLYVYPLFRLH